MSDLSNEYEQYFLSYSGIKLPLKLVGEIDGSEVKNRNTFFGARYDNEGRVILIHKRVYNEIELEHRYIYNDDGQLMTAYIIDADGEEDQLNF